MVGLITNVLLYVVPFLLVLTLVITIHELGHFLVARWLGVEVERFSIGFGRGLFSRVDKSGVEWRVGWIPLGGYVKFAGDAEASSTVPDGESLEKLRGEIVAREGAGAERRYFHFKPVWVRALVTAAGPLANFVLSIVLFSVMAGVNGDLVVTPRLGGVRADSPAEKAGFQRGDLITAIEGKPITDFFELKQFVMFRAGEPIRFTVDRGGLKMDITATPVRRDETDRLTGGQARFGSLGLEGPDNPKDIFYRHYNPVESVGVGVNRTWTILKTTTFYLGRIVRGLESGDQLGGPLRIAATSGAVAKAGAEGATDLSGKLTGGAAALFSLAAVLSVGIGFMNLLPVPVLDGGHLLFYAYESLAKRPLAARVQAAGYRVGLALLLCLMLFATWNDLQQLRVFKFLGSLFS